MTSFHLSSTTGQHHLKIDSTRFTPPGPADGTQAINLHGYALSLMLTQNELAQLRKAVGEKEIKSLQHRVSEISENYERASRELTELRAKLVKEREKQALIADRTAREQSRRRAQVDDLLAQRDAAIKDKADCYRQLTELRHQHAKLQMTGTPQPKLSLFSDLAAEERKRKDSQIRLLTVERDAARADAAASASAYRDIVQRWEASK
ncbi:hypothetical protein GCM10010331_45420 [Streptomyces xanthochromogenes]|uniref:hypothetical protein n=1 Tax=Streptomyces xanthochromogenes TaxID=67384 RepID=UPI0016779F69|nr:hypothetical protein [Streptomyces xanthochromogenes]GHB52698.1 hypothetical protein GCM10010331_45420 [Streptomyces xanthochromogenes]